MMKKPNIVLVLTDDQGYGDLGCHGNTVLKTPNIDQFYDQSIRFSNFHVGPTCAPTRSGLFTGHYANSTGVWHTVGGRSLLRKDEFTLASALNEQGYRTALFGKWHLGDNYPYRPQDRGFETVVMHGGGGISQTPDYWGNDYFDDTFYTNGVPKQYEGYCTDVFFGLGIDYIQERAEAREPFFCCITTNAPHAPYNVEKKYSDPYIDKVEKEDRAKFYGMIANIDENFRKLDKKLEELGIADDTILIYMTDNGTSCGGEGYNTTGLRGYKNSPYDGGHRVPFFLRYGNGKMLSPRDINNLTAHVDFMPTLLELAGIDTSDTKKFNFHGKSLVPFLREENPDWQERCIVTDSQRLVNPVKCRSSAVMDERWRLINGSELYDINADRGQEHDISSRHPEVVTRLRSEYDKWWDLVSIKFDEEIPISIGSDSEILACLCSHDWRHNDNPIETDPFVKERNAHLAFHQGHIRQGAGDKGYFEIFVEETGSYEFELRRWPMEEDRAITKGIEESYEGFRYDVIQEKNHQYYLGGQALEFVKANISIGDQKDEKLIEPKAKGVKFQLDLEKGPSHLRAHFLDDNGTEKGAYYVYVRKNG